MARFVRVAVVIRLVTVVDFDDGPVAPNVPMIAGPAPKGFEPSMAPLDPGPGLEFGVSMSLTALHLAVLHDGRRLTLLDDRGWSVSGPPDLWDRTSMSEVEQTARTVVGPDEPFGDHSYASMAADHWAALATTLQRHGIPVGAIELSRLTHDVELTERLRARLIHT